MVTINMPKTKNKTEYSTVNFPKEMIVKIQKLIDGSNKFFYRNPAEFCIESARIRLYDFMGYPAEKKKLVYCSGPKDKKDLKQDIKKKNK